jgi:hypothetical protein
MVTDSGYNQAMQAHFWANVIRDFGEDRAKLLGFRKEKKYIVF